MGFDFIFNFNKSNIIACIQFRKKCHHACQAAVQMLPGKKFYNDISMETLHVFSHTEFMSDHSVTSAALLKVAL